MGIRKIAFATGTRADWGLLSPLARALAARDDCRVTVLATNMHLQPEYGDTIREVEADGLSDVRRVAMPQTGDTPLGTVGAMAGCMTAMAAELDALKPDLIVILGDRFEMLATATAALMLRIPIVHIAGGEISEGAIDDSIRHAITKMASLHLTATEPYRQRVIAMGEEPERVINTGAIGVSMFDDYEMDLSEVRRIVGFDIADGTLLVTYHPATLDDGDPAERFGELLKALDRFPDHDVIITYPNNDARGRVIIDMIEEYGRQNPQRVKVIPSLGHKRYLAALELVDAVVGNSSSGIVEVPSFGIPTVDIGIRQRGRVAADSVIHCGDSADEIETAIAKALTDEYQSIAHFTVNPYYREGTLGLMVKAIAETPLETLTVKKFHDVCPL